MKLFCRTCYEAFYEGALREQRLESAANMQLLKNYENKERALHIFLKRYPNNLILDFLHYDDYFEVMSVEFLSHAKQVSNGDHQKIKLVKVRISKTYRLDNGNPIF